MNNGLNLRDEVLRLLREQGYIGATVAETFGVGVTWLSDVERGVIKSPRADTLQAMYEKLTGKALLPRNKNND